MKTKRILSLLMAVIFCLSSFVAFAEEITYEQELAEEYFDYASMYLWSSWNKGKDKSTDLFFVCPTVDMGKNGNYIADIHDEKFRESFDGAINMELGIYGDDVTVYAPYYRQATFPVYSLSEKEQEKYLEIAYQDVKKAFIYYADRKSVV